MWPIKKKRPVPNKRVPKTWGCVEAKKNIKKCSPSLVIKETQIKSTFRFHFAPVRMANINKTTCNKQILTRILGTGSDIHFLLIAVTIGVAPLDINVKNLPKTKIKSTIWHSYILISNVSKGLDILYYRYYLSNVHRCPIQNC